MRNTFNGYRIVKGSYLTTRYLRYCYEHCHYGLTRKQSKKLGYEKHHLLPKSILYILETQPSVNPKKLYKCYRDGTNTVMLTPEEHIKAHQLLNEALTIELKKKLNYHRMKV